MKDNRDPQAVGEMLLSYQRANEDRGTPISLREANDQLAKLGVACRRVDETEAQFTARLSRNHHG